MKKLYYLAILLALLTLSSKCENENENNEGNNANRGAPNQSDPSCPPPTTFGSGGPPGGPISLGILHGRKSGGTGLQVNMLLKEFNNAAQRLGDAYCAKKGCYAEIVPAESQHIKTGKSDSFLGWTELTIQPTGGNPKTVTQGLNVYFSYIDPPSPNCYCKEYVIEDITIKPEDLIPVTPPTNPPVPNDPPPVTPPVEDCGNPTPALTIKKGTRLDLRAWHVESYFTDLENYPGLTDYANTSGPAAAEAFLKAQLSTVQCPAGCEPYFDPEPKIRKESGYATYPKDTYIIRFILDEDVTVKCRPKQ